MPTELASPEKEQIQHFFDSIAPRYDFLNSFLSFRLDEAWRARACDLVLDGPAETVLDLGVGTGKFLKALARRRDVPVAVGLDFSPSMLRAAQKQLSPDTGFTRADFHHLPFSSERFDLILSAFTLRSVKDMPGFLAEVRRVLKPGGRAAFLCLTRPRHPLWNAVYLPYLKFYLPLMGRLISRHAQAYDFLSQSIQHFQEPEKTAAVMRNLGFEAELYRFSFGSATLIIGKKN